LWFADGDDSLQHSVGKLLIERGIDFALAESCTGGLVAAQFTEVPGISAVFKEGFVTYADRTKTQRLGVPPELIATHGAVSAEVALAMARGVRSVAAVRLGASITGLAGPGGGSADKPVGTVFFAVDLDGRVVSLQRFYGGLPRSVVRERAARDLLFLIWRCVRQLAKPRHRP
jgi:PncC family amidohydrolase